VEKIDRTVVFQISLTIAVLVLIAIFIGWLSSNYTNNATEQVTGAITDSDLLFRESNQRILPVGHVCTQSIFEEYPEHPSCAQGAEASTVVEVKRTGEEVVDYLCASCHTAGVGGAPKLDDAADWGARYAQGMDALMEIGLNGKAGTTMMPKGGDTNLSDDDIWNSIVAMLTQAGVSITETQRVAAPEQAPAEDAAQATDAAAEIVTNPVDAVVDAVAAPVEALTEAAEAVVEEAGSEMKSMMVPPSEMIVDKTTTAIEAAVEAVADQ